MMVRCSLIAGVLAVAVGGCTSDPGDPFPSAAAQMACAPFDGPAVQVDLGLRATGPSTPPYVRVYVYRSLGQIGGNTWSLDPPNELGVATFCPANGACVDAIRGLVRFDAGAGVSGFVDLTFPPNTRIRGSFQAAVREIHVQCG